MISFLLVKPSQSQLSEFSQTKVSCSSGRGGGHNEAISACPCRPPDAETAMGGRRSGIKADPAQRTHARPGAVGCGVALGTEPWRLRRVAIGVSLGGRAAA